MKVLLATHNSGKLREMQMILAGVVECVTPTDVGLAEDFDVEETGDTFQENAWLKAQAFGQQTGLLTLADDSGLAVAALNGAPGVKSKRFVPGTDHDRNLHLLKVIEKATDRSAYFITVLCLFDPVTKVTHFFEGRVDGTLAESERGQTGFGYDPLFIPTRYQETFGELRTEVKNTLSHRARALQKLREFLKTDAK